MTVEKLIKPLLLFISAVVLNFYITPSAPDYGYIKNILLVIGSPILLICVLLLVPNKTKLEINLFGLLWLGLLLLGVISIFWSINKSFTAVELFRWLSLGLVALSIVFIVKSDKSRLDILKLMVFLGILISIIGLIQHIFDVDIVEQVGSPASVFGNPNMAAQVLVLLTPLGIFLFLFEKERNKKYFWGIGVSLILSYIFHTKTASAWLATATQLLVVTLYFFIVRKSFNSNLKIDWHAALASIFILFCLINLSNKGVVPFWEQINQEFSGVAKRAVSEEKVAPRYQLWMATVDSIKESPIIGSGVGTFYEQMKVHGYFNFYLYKNSHNDYLDLISELGVIGFALFLVILIAIIKALLNNMSKKPFSSSIFISISIFGILIVSLFSFPMQMAAPLLIMTVLITLNRDSYMVGTFKHTFKINKNIKILSICLLLLYSLFLVFIHIEWGGAIRQAHKVGSPKDEWMRPNIDHPIVYTISASNSTRLFAQRDFSKSIEISNKILNIDNDFYWANFIKANSLISIGAHDRAFQYAEKAYKKGPKKDIRLALLLIKMHLDKGNKADAFKVFKGIEDQEGDLINALPQQVKDELAIVRGLVERLNL